MANVSPECKDTHHPGCPGVTMDELGQGKVVLCECDCHQKADQEYRATLAAALEAHRVAAENEQARQDSLDD